VLSFAPTLKLALHPQHLASFQKRENFAPVSVEISPSHLCNAKCPSCWYVVGDQKPAHSRDYLNFALLLSVLDDFADMGVEALTWTGGGDPSIYPQINQAIEAAAHHGLKQAMFTNGYVSIERPDLLRWIRLTITDRLTVPKCASEYAQKTRVGVNVNLAPWNESHLLRLAQEAKAAGCHYFQVRPALADRLEDQKPILLPKWLKELETPDFEVVLTDYKWDDYTKPHPYETCHGHQITPFIWHNGDVGTCAYQFGKPEFTFGNLSRETFKEIWNGERRRDMLARGVKVKPSCQVCCKLHETNKVLASLRGEFEMVRDRSFV